MSVKSKVSTVSLVCYFLIVVLFAIVRMLTAFGVFDGLGKNFDYALNVVSQVVILFCLSIFLFSAMQKNKVKDTFKFFGYKKISFKAVLICIGIGIIVYFLNIFIATFFNSILALFGYSSSSSVTYLSSYPFWIFLINILVTAVLPGVCEETVHRGLLLKGLSGFGERKALVISSLLFGFMHMNIDQFFYATLIGFLLGYLALISDSIFPAMIVHFINNALSVFASYSSFNSLGFEKIIGGFNAALELNFFLGFLLVVVFMASLSFLLFILIKQLFRETTVKNMAKLEQTIIKQMEKENYIKQLETVASEGENQTQPTTISFEEFDKLYKLHNQKMGLMSNLEQNMLSSPNVKMTTFQKILSIGILIIVASVTIFTFIWGIL